MSGRPHDRDRLPADDGDRRDLARRVLAAAEPELAQRRARVQRRLRLSALVIASVLAGGLGSHLLLAARELRAVEQAPVDPLQASLARLARSFDPPVASDAGADASGAPVRSPGAPVIGGARDTGLAGLALLALARGAPPGAPAPADARTERIDADALRQGALRLAEALEAGELLGPDDPGRQDRGLATLALVEAFARTGEATIGAAARRGVARLARDGERAVSRPPTGSELVATAWELQALLAAQALRLGGDLQPAIAAARARLLLPALPGASDPAVLAASVTPDRRALDRAALGTLPAGATAGLGDLYAASLSVLREARKDGPER